MGDKATRAPRDEEGRRADAARQRRPGRERGAGRSRSRRDIGYPVIIKAVAGGGGRGMRVVRDAGRTGARASSTAQREAEAAFGVGDVYLEKYVEAPRHIEFQILGDHHGNVVHLGERECSIQRRHQKLHRGGAVDRRSPTRCAARWARTVVDAARAVQYTNAGTVEFLMDADGQLLLHGGEHAPPGRAPGHRDGDRHRHRQGADPDRGGRAAVVQAGRRRRSRGHAIECRINAEDPETFVAVARRRSTRSACRAGPACAWTPPRTPSARSRRTTTR